MLHVRHAHFRIIPLCRFLENNNVKQSHTGSGSQRHLQLRKVNCKCFWLSIEIATKYELSRVNERDLSRMVQGPTFLSLTAWRHVSQAKLTQAISGPKSRAKIIMHHVQSYCSLGSVFALHSFYGTSSQ